MRLKDELLYHWPAVASLSERAHAVLGAVKLYEGRLDTPEVKVEAMFSSPQDTMQANRALWFFVQGTPGCKTVAFLLRSWKPTATF